MGLKTLMEAELDQQPVARGELCDRRGEYRLLFALDDKPRRIGIFVLVGAESIGRRIQLTQAIDGHAHRNQSHPARQGATALTAKLAQFFAIIGQHRDEEILEEILHRDRLGMDMIGMKRSLDRVVNQIGILRDEGIPGGFLATDALCDEILFLRSHETALWSVSRQVS